MTIPLTRVAEALAIPTPDLVVLIRSIPGAPYILRGDRIYADPKILGPFLTDHGIPVAAPYADEDDSSETPDDNDDDDVDDDDGDDDGDDEDRADANARGRRPARRGERSRRR